MRCICGEINARHCPVHNEEIRGTHQERKGAGGSESSCSASEPKRPSEIGSSPMCLSMNTEHDASREFEPSAPPPILTAKDAPEWGKFCAWEEDFWQRKGRYPRQFEVWQAALSTLKGTE